MSYQVDPQVSETFKQLKLKRKFRWALFGVTKTDPKTHVVMDTCGDKTKTVDDLLAALPDADCRYVVYEHEYTTSDGRKADKLFFITWCPRASHNSLKMEYATARPFIRPVCDGCFDVNASTGRDIVDAITGEGGRDDDDADDDDNDDWLSD